jgi:hypothetical protein
MSSLAYHIFSPTTHGNLVVGSSVSHFCTWFEVCYKQTTTLNTICEWNFVLHHRPTKWINKKLKKVHISMPYQSFRATLYVTYNPSFKILNILNQLRNDGSFCETMKPSSNLPKCRCFVFFNFFDKYPNCPSISSCVWPLGRSPLVYFRKHMREKDIFLICYWSNGILLTYFKYILNIYTKYSQNGLLALYLHLN